MHVIGNNGSLPWRWMRCMPKVSPGSSTASSPDITGIRPAWSRSCGRCRKPATGYRRKRSTGCRRRGVASFYSFLAIEPRGEYRLLFSDNITDRMAGSERLMNALCHRLWVEPGKVSEDGLVSVDRTSCTGLCDQGPALLATRW